MKHKQQSISGFSIIEVMVALTILLFILSGVGIFIRQQSSTMVGMRIVNSRDQIANRILAAASSAKALQVSASKQGNMNYWTCITKSNCPAVPMGFHLHDSFGRKLAGSEGANGKPDNPVYYTADGAFCAEKSPQQCLLQATTKFMVVCAGKSSSGSCAQPVRVKVFYTVSQVPGTKLTGIGSLFALKEREANEVAIAEILKPSTETRCPGPGEFVRAIRPNGEIDCAVPTAAGGVAGVAGMNGTNGLSSSVGAVRCSNPGEILRGFDASGKPDCVTTLGAIGFQKIDAMTTNYSNPNPNANGPKCGWQASVEMRHVWGKVCCPSGKVPMGGGGSCNYDSGGFLEISRPEGKNCWMVDCCKYVKGANPPHSPIFVQCIFENQAP